MVEVIATKTAGGLVQGQVYKFAQGTARKLIARGIAALYHDHRKCVERCGYEIQTQSLNRGEVR